ncbi:MAG: cobalt ECF transporter T component CbiQ [Oculatellaceae cyanobacterium bins.114]|nr:cobalt ECF transporter T component CbiQ [Oculatellaceae cyanobacterium bins.114]
MLLHTGAFRLDIDSQRPTLWQYLAPQTRILCVLLFVFATALTPNGRWLTWAVYAVVLAIALLISRITLSVLVRRVAVEFLFLIVILVGTVFRQGGTVVWQWGWLQITSGGLIVLGSVTLKAFLSLVMLNLLVLTTSIPALLQALTALRTPPLLVAIMASMYRYIGVLAEEFSAMRRAAASRNLTGSQHWQRLVVGNTIGALFIRTYERGDRIHQAMLARGYTGLVPLIDAAPQIRRIDIIALTVTLILALLGQVIYL